MATATENVDKITVATQSPEEKKSFTFEEFLRLQEELAFTQRENRQCWQHVQRLETTLARMRSAAQCSKDERDRLKKKVRELQTRLTNVSNCDAVKSERVNVENDRSVPANASTPSTACHLEDWRPPTQAIAPKLAERVRLRRFSTEDVLGAEICSLGMSNVSLAEHLTESIQDASQLQQLYRSLISSARKQEFEIELENLQRQASRMKSQISFLELTLNESRALSDNLSSVCAQLESNNTALQLVLMLDVYVEQALDCLLRLGDSHLAFMLTSCQAVHCADGDKDDELMSLAQEERGKAEYGVEALLQRLESEVTMLVGDSGLSVGADGLDDRKPWRQSDEVKLRSFIGRLKTRRDEIRRSIVEVQSNLNIGVDRRDGRQISSLQEEKLSLENAVLLQELMAMKEEKTQLKAELFIVEKQNEILELTVRGKQLELESVKPNLGKPLEKIDKDDDQSTTNVADNIQTLDESMVLTESILLNQEERQRKSEYLIEHLKRVNVSLMGKLGRSKRRHKAKLSRLQQALRYVSEQYELEISTLRNQTSTEARDSGNETLYSNVSEV